MAVMVVPPVVRLEARPRLVMVAIPGAEELHNTSCVMSWVELSLNVPVALNCLVAPTGIEEFNGSMARATSVAVETVTDVLADTEPEVPVTVAVPAETAVASPFPSMVRTLGELDNHAAETSR